MTRPPRRLWFLIALPFLALPLIFLSGLVVPHEDLWGHAAFHIAYIPLVVAALVTTVRYARSVEAPVLRWGSRALAGVLAVFLIGHLGEFAVVIANGFHRAPESLFDTHPHLFFANIAIPSAMLSLLLLAALSATASVGRRRQPSGARAGA